MIGKTKIIISLVLLALVLSVTACSSSTGNNGPIKATWIEPQITADNVSVPISEVEDRVMTHFTLASVNGDMSYMAYQLDGKFYVRANVCPPCRSIGFSLNKDTLVCDTCRTTFSAKTGKGITGACVDFPKAAVPYEINSNQLVMKGTELLTAYQNTLKPGLP